MPSLVTLNPSKYCTVVQVNVDWGHFPSATVNTFIFAKWRNLFTLCTVYLSLIPVSITSSEFHTHSACHYILRLIRIPLSPPPPPGLILGSRKPVDHSPSRATWLHFSSSQSINRRRIFFPPHTQYLNSRLLTKSLHLLSFTLNVCATVTASSILLHFMTLLTFHPGTDCCGTFFIPVYNFLLHLITPFL